MIETDEAFHRAIYEACGNPLVQQTAARHWPHIRRAMGAVLTRPESREPVWDQHEAIVKAINAGRAGEAERLAREHGEFGGRTVSALLAQPRAAAGKP